MEEEAKDASDLSEEEIEALFEEELEEQPDVSEGEPEKEGELQTGPAQMVEVSEESVDMSDLPQSVQRILDIQVPLVAILARKKMKLKDVLSIRSGMVLQLGKPLEEPLQLCIGQEEIAKGETVKVGEHFGFRVRDIKDAESTIKMFQHHQK